MALMLVLGLSLFATSGVLVLRSFALARAQQRRTLDQIAIYGFRSNVTAEKDAADLRAMLGVVATATGGRRSRASRACEDASAACVSC